MLGLLWLIPLAMLCCVPYGLKVWRVHRFRVAFVAGKMAMMEGLCRGYRQWVSERKWEAQEKARRDARLETKFIVPDESTNYKGPKGFAVYENGATVTYQPYITTSIVPAPYYGKTTLLPHEVWEYMQPPKRKIITPQEYKESEAIDAPPNRSR